MNLDKGEGGGGGVVILYFACVFGIWVCTTAGEYFGKAYNEIFGSKNITTTKSGSIVVAPQGSRTDSITTSKEVGALPQIGIVDIEDVPSLINKDGKSKKSDKKIDDKMTVKEILKYKQGNIKRAPLPKGGPGWEALLALTLEEIRKLAHEGDRYFKEILKLLTDNRFNK